jgi:hypothetical protein
MENFKFLFLIISGVSLSIIAIRNKLNYKIPSFGAIISDKIDIKLDKIDIRLAIVSLISFIIFIILFAMY